MKTFISQNGWLLLFLLALLLFVGLATLQLGLPGLNYDEALDAVPAMQLVQGQPVEAAATVRVRGRDWPLMVMPYIGAVSTYLYLPLFALLGPEVTVLRLTNVLVALVALLLIGGFLRSYVDSRVAGLTVLLLAVNPTFVFWARMGNYVALPMLPIAIATLWALWRWYRDGQPRFLLVSAFLFGLGLSTKIIFLWVGNALILAWLLLSPAMSHAPRRLPWRWPLQHTTWWQGLASVLAALVGSGMILLYNLRDQGTFGTIRRNAVQTELYGINNLDLLANLRLRLLVDFRQLLDGGWFEEVIGGPHRNPLLPLAFVIATVALPFLLRRMSGRYPPRRIAFLVLLLVALVLQSTVTLSAFGANHLMILWPIPQTIIVVAILSLADRLRNRLPRAAPSLAMLLVVILVGSELFTTLSYHRTLQQTGGRIYYSDAIYDVAAELEAAGVEAPVVLDWGFERNLTFISQGRLQPEEPYLYIQPPGELFEEYINWRVSQGEGLFLFHPPEHTAFGGHQPLFEQAAYRHRLVPYLWKQYQERSGDPIILVYDLRPVAPQFAPPAAMQPLDVQLGTHIQLLGYRLPPDDGSTPTLTLYWRTSTEVETDYKVFVHLLDAEGTLAAQVDSVPVDWGYPTPEWLAGEVVEDRIQLPLDELPPGNYTLTVGMYDSANGVRLPLQHSGARMEGDMLALEEIGVE